MLSSALLYPHTRNKWKVRIVHRTTYIADVDHVDDAVRCGQCRADRDGHDGRSRIPRDVLERRRPTCAVIGGQVEDLFALGDAYVYFAVLDRRPSVLVALGGVPSFTGSVDFHLIGPDPVEWGRPEVKLLPPAYRCSVR
jgi:hypothetical protein